MTTITYTPDSLRMAEQNVAMFERRLATTVDKQGTRRQIRAAKLRVRQIKAARDNGGTIEVA